MVAAVGTRDLPGARAGTVQLALVVMYAVLALMPYMLAFSAGMFLTAWLRLQWIP